MATCGAKSPPPDEDLSSLFPDESGEHLHMLINPAEVAAAIISLAAEAAASAASLRSLP